MFLGGSGENVGVPLDVGVPLGAFAQDIGVCRTLLQHAVEQLYGLVDQPHHVVVLENLGPVLDRGQELKHETAIGAEG